MKVTIFPTQIKGTLQAPSSKSSLQRACAAALLRNGRSIIQYPGHSNDDKAAIEIIKSLGANVEVADNELQVTGQGFPNDLSLSNSSIDCGESGLSIRMFTPIVSLSDKKIGIKGSGSLATRPMDFFDEVLPSLQVKIESNAGKLPINVQGPLQPANITVDGSLSSQFLTGLLMSYAAALSNNKNSSPVSIKVNNLKSKPYIDLTLDVMKQFGMNVPVNNNYEEFVFDSSDAVSADSAEAEIVYTVEADWSGAAFLLVAGAIAGPIMINGLDLNSTQADKAIVDALMNAGAGIAIEAKGIRIHPTKMHGFYFDATDCPDLFPPLVALAAYCKGKTTIKGVSRLTHKESNRALTLQDEFDKMFVTIDLDGDDMIIHGTGKVRGADVHSSHDHRIAMACAVAALRADGETTIEEAMAIKKSYPDFYNDLKKLGANIELPFEKINL